MSDVRAHCAACGATFTIPGPPRCVPLDLAGSVVPCPACGGAAEILPTVAPDPPAAGSESAEA